MTRVLQPIIQARCDGCWESDERWVLKVECNRVCQRLDERSEGKGWQRGLQAFGLSTWKESCHYLRNGRSPVFSLGPVMFEMPSDRPSESAKNKVFGTYLVVAQ